MSRGGGGGLRPVAPGFTPVPWGTPNPDAPGTKGPLGRPSQLPAGNTAQTNALMKDILQHYPGARISGWRSPDTQASIRAGADKRRGKNAGAWVASKYGSSHVWGTALDVVVGPKMWEQFKKDMRARGLRAYDEGTHIHIDDRTDLPDGPAERHRH